MRPAAALLLLLVVLTGCGTAPPPPVDSWIVRREPAVAASEKDTGAAVVAITGVDVAAHLDGIVVQRSDGKMDTLIFHRWAAPVGEMVRAWVRSRLAESSRVRGVVGAGDSCDLRIRLEVRRFEFVETPSGAEAVVELWGLIGQVPFGPITATETLGEPSGAGLPAAMSAALGGAVDRLVPLVESASSSSGH